MCNQNLFRGNSEGSVNLCCVSSYDEQHHSYVFSILIESEIRLRNKFMQT